MRLFVGIIFYILVPKRKKLKREEEEGEEEEEVEQMRNLEHRVIDQLLRCYRDWHLRKRSNRQVNLHLAILDNILPLILLLDSDCTILHWSNDNLLQEEKVEKVEKEQEEKEEEEQEEKEEEELNRNCNHLLAYQVYHRVQVLNQQQ